MKFGKRFKNAQKAGWVYIDYKTLKQVIKQLFAATADYASAEREFEQELRQGITAVNSFFIEKERQLTAELPNFDGSTDGQSGIYNQASAFFDAVGDLYHCAILNTLAVLKILKKHDKHSRAPLRTGIVETLFAQAFYLSLEHSYLFSACANHPNSATATAQATIHTNAALGDVLLHETLEVPEHLLKCCLNNGGIVGAPLDFSMLRADAASRGVEVQIESLLTLAGGLASGSRYATDAIVGGGGRESSGDPNSAVAVADEGVAPRAAEVTPRPISPSRHIRKEASVEVDDGCFGCDDGPRDDFPALCAVRHERASMAALPTMAPPATVTPDPTDARPRDDYEAPDLTLAKEHSRTLLFDFEDEDVMFKIEE